MSQILYLRFNLNTFSMLRFGRIIVLLSAFFFVSIVGNAQFVKETPQFQRKWVLGGDFGLGFSNYGSNIAISPQIGYRLTNAWEVGTRLTYNYYSYRQDQIKFTTNNYGGGFYTIYELFAGFFAQAENEILSYEKVYFDPLTFDIMSKERTTVHSVFIGGGYRQYFSSRGFASITVLYNLNETPDTPYSNPLFRIGFGFGL